MIAFVVWLVLLVALVALPTALMNLTGMIELRRHKRKLFRGGRIRKYDEWER